MKLIEPMPSIRVDGMADASSSSAPPIVRGTPQGTAPTRRICGAAR